MPCVELLFLIENHTGLRDPYRARWIIHTDVTAFRHLSLEGPVTNVDGEVDMPSYTFWFLTVMDSHAPVLRKFDRFPWRNRAVGRVDEEKEEVFLRLTNWFGCASVDIDAIIKERLEDGRQIALLGEASSIG